MAHVFEFDLREFSSAQAAAATGVSPELQRNWRRYGFLKEETGHARYDVFELAEMWVLNAVGKFGIGPKTAKSYANEAGRLIVWHILHRLEAYQDTSKSPFGLMDMKLDKTGDHWKVPFSKYVKSNKSIGIGKKPTKLSEWAFRQRWLADHIVHGMDATEATERFFIVFDNGTAVASQDGWVPDWQKVKGAYVCLPLADAAVWILAALDAPAIRVSWNGDPVEVPTE